jgi:hypothetical protein
MSQAENISSTRRNLVAVAGAAVLPAFAIAASVAPHPIFAAIDAHRVAL